jgi:hypothetical protein
MHECSESSKILSDDLRTFISSGSRWKAKRTDHNERTANAADIRGLPLEGVPYAAEADSLKYATTSFTLRLIRRTNHVLDVVGN